MTEATSLPAPLTPPDCNLRGLPFMPLEIGRLLDSDLFIKSTGDEFKAALALWCKSWTQLPGGSLPNDEVVLEDLSRSKVWKKVRAVAMRGWIECSDGRLYHPVVAEQARVAWEGRIEHQESADNKTSRQQRWRQRCADLSEQLRALGITPPAGAAAKTLEKLLTDEKRRLNVDGNTSTSASTGDDPETACKGQGEGQRQGHGDSVPIGTGAGGAKITDPDEIIFGYGVPLLVKAGNEEKHARSFLGKLRKEHGDEAVIDRLREAIRQRPLQPLEWLAAALPPKGSAKATAGSPYQQARAARMAEAVPDLVGGSPADPNIIDTEARDVPAAILG